MPDCNCSGIQNLREPPQTCESPDNYTTYCLIRLIVNEIDELNVHERFNISKMADCSAAAGDRGVKVELTKKDHEAHRRSRAAADCREARFKRSWTKQVHGHGFLHRQIWKELWECEGDICLVTYEIWSQTIKGFMYQEQQLETNVRVFNMRWLK
ncbi:hypothetical protein F2P81_010116 [Scophthalmus maximus]|uniref:Uncharacterized protein n=1 Tax=Scophthalmus maximus TaxID=52904 RepID=A0A6A4T4Y3_SCOMX|nr:hypothetical protein F2P81_010116 [Scophthalmus maximus]